jgi:hypothetical protein
MQIKPKRKRPTATTAAMLMALISGALPATAHSQDGLRNAAAAEKQPNGATSGDFSVLQIATTDPDRLTADWLKPTAAVSLTTTTQTVRNQPIVTFIVFKGCRPDASGNCNVTVDYETLAPDGKRYDITKGAEVWVGHPPAPNLNLQLSVAGYGLKFEPKDPPGPYRVRASITDHVSSITLNTEQVLTVTAN